MFVVVMRILCSVQKKYEWNHNEYSWKDTSYWRVKREATQMNNTSLDFQSKNESNLYGNKNNTSDIIKLIARFKQEWPVEYWLKLGYFEENYLYLINEHWLHFPPPDPVVHRILGSIYIFFSTIGSWGNIIVLTMYLR